MFIILTLSINNVKAVYNKKNMIIVTSEYSVNIWSKILKNKLTKIIIDNSFGWNIEEIINTTLIIDLDDFIKKVNENNIAKKSIKLEKNDINHSSTNKKARFTQNQTFAPIEKEKSNIKVKHSSLETIDTQTIDTQKSLNNEEESYKAKDKDFMISEKINNNKFNITKNIKDKIIMPKAQSLNFDNKTIIITSEKGGIGKTTYIYNLINSISNTLFIDLNFQEGGSDLSFMLNLPQNPNITTFLLEKNFNKSVLSISNDNLILQAPMYSNSIKYLDKCFIANIKNSFQGNIFIDMPHLSINECYYDILNDSDVILIISAGSKSEVSRIVTKYKDLLDKVTILLTDNNTDFLLNLNVKYFLLKPDIISTLNNIRLG
ncbi:hypothetical protein EJM73_06015 [Clostridium botulinum]|uniref:AAA domain-containing protein n=1 Tax=Clostridium botulinum TaxID=1491 RepID=A0AA43YA50_CLOBO|nr:hypothetical protein [Clostridium botulinum]NCI20805.1 hypothetical protein [Clostridium botulinum]NCI35219.1 hypothetical protein [Clostridium botulinum]NCI72189.1 hypothetical protein [Clostridium botulinum]NDI38302.1 hypothetical protein [Clostridium botulinum]NFI08839.1 hypothetical protein [Clostridium botulinum]